MEAKSTTKSNKKDGQLKQSRFFSVPDTGLKLGQMILDLPKFLPSFVHKITPLDDKHKIASKSNVKLNTKVWKDAMAWQSWAFACTELMRRTSSSLRRNPIQ